MKINFNML